MTQYKHNPNGVYALYLKDDECWAESGSIKNTQLPIIDTDNLSNTPHLDSEVQVNKYTRKLIGLNGVVVPVDVYRVLDAFNVDNPQLQHLIKKALAAGKRGHKDIMQDLLDIKESIQSAIIMQEQKKAV